MNDSQPPQAPSPQFLQAAQQLAGLMGEDLAKVISGATLTYKGIAFCLKHHGGLDPAAMVLAVETAPVSEATAAQAFKALLRGHFDSPVAVTGYYAIPPDREAIVWCLRIDLDTEPNPVGKLAFVIEQMATGREITRDVIGQAIDKARRSRDNAFDNV